MGFAAFDFAALFIAQVIRKETALGLDHEVKPLGEQRGTFWFNEIK
jgi:hypothetical protein